MGRKEGQAGPDRTGSDQPVPEAPFDRHRAVVLPEWIDYNGHMNVAYYLLAFDHATDSFFDYLGLDAAHRDATGGSTFAGDVHLTYQREVKQGDPLRITAQLLGFDDKRVRFFLQMYHAEEGFLAATMEGLTLYVDLKRRKVAPFPPEITARLAAVFAAHRALPLPPEAGRVIAKPPLLQP
jgi:acyl-CoA thioester hydrolase